MSDTPTTWHKRWREFRWQTPEHFNFGAMVDHFARDHSRVALLWEDEAGNRARFTFADIAARSNQVANVLHTLGVKRGDAVLLLLPRTPYWQVCYIAALKLGALAIPCTSMLREKDLVYRANHSEAVAIIATRENATMVGDLRSHCPSLRHFLLTGSASSGWTSLPAAMHDASSKFAHVATRASEPALCYYTSGTTRDPKAVLHSHAYTWSLQYSGHDWLNVKEGEVHWSPTDTGWAKAAHGVLFGPWMNGATTLMYNGRFDPKKELELLQRYRVASFCAPPTEYRLLVKEDLARRPLPDLRHCASAGEPLNPEVIEVWKQCTGIAIHDGYGQTESMILAANFPDMPIKPGSMGVPFPGHDVRVVDDDLKETPDGEVGEMALRIKPERPPSLFLEYWKSPAENAAAFRGDYYLTGDQVMRDSDGYLWFVGRADDLIISAGYRIGPFEVESALLEHASVLESAVVASPDPDRGSIVKAFVKLRAGVVASDTLARELQNHVKRVTAPYKYPREIEFVDELPRTVTGKLRRAELRRHEEQRKRAVT
ncbi:MAG TPA: acyl--CoA ligase [Candidatus Binataceae bacterium]|nr:acyl--CoA ligase [Candidatus Binataceae bacterium]